MQAADKQSDRIGMLLDLDRGSMTVYKNGERLGVMQAGASHLCVLSGEYVWAVVLKKGPLGLDSDQSPSARIEPTDAPESPTAEELTQAEVWIPQWGEHGDCVNA